MPSRQIGVAVKHVILRQDGHGPQSSKGQRQASKARQPCLVAISMHLHEGPPHRPRLPVPAVPPVHGEFGV